MMADITIRQAKSEDKEDVMRIQENVYGGADYLPEYYDEFMTCQNTTSYVAIMKDQIVGFTSMFLVDDGKTVISRASRVSPSVEGKGVYKILHNYSLKETPAECVAFTANNLNESVKKPSFQREYTFLGSKSLSAYEVGKENFSWQSVDIGKLHTPSDEELITYFKSKTIKPYLFPMDRLIVDWVQFRLLKPNIPLMKKNHRARFYSDVTEGENGKVHGLLSISVTKRVQNPPYVCDLNIYGTDTETLFQHISVHVRSMMELSDGCKNIKLAVLAEQEFDYETLEKVVAEVGLSKSIASDKNGLLYTHMYMFEKKLLK